MSTDNFGKVKVCPDKLIFFRESCFGNSHQFAKKPTYNKPEGLLSNKAKKRISDRITWLVFISKEKSLYCKVLKKNLKFKINFITLTLPSAQVHSDNDIKNKCLDSFLSWLRKGLGVKHYFWKAETQSNGNIHFHLVLDKYIHYMDIRNRWNSALELLGYISAFKEKFGHSSPNSTDVHSVRKIKKLPNYLIKYMSKNEKNKRKIEGKIWDCSEKLNSYINPIFDSDDYCKEIDFIFSYHKEKIKYFEYFSLALVSIFSLGNCTNGWNLITDFWSAQPK